MEESNNIKNHGEHIKAKMSWSNYFYGAIRSFYWLSPIGYFNDRPKFHLYWYILSHL